MESHVALLVLKYIHIFQSYNTVVRSIYRISGRISFWEGTDQLQFSISIYPAFNFRAVLDSLTEVGLLYGLTN